MGIGTTLFCFSTSAMNERLARMDKAGQKIAKGGDLLEPMTTMVVEPRVYAANAAVIRTKDEMLGTLLDVVA